MERRAYQPRLAAPVSAHSSLALPTGMLEAGPQGRPPRCCRKTGSWRQLTAATADVPLRRARVRQLIVRSAA